MKAYKLFDTKEQQYLTDSTYDRQLTYPNKKAALDGRDDYLEGGNYPDDPVTVIEIHEFDKGAFVQQIH